MVDTWDNNETRKWQNITQIQCAANQHFLVNWLRHTELHAHDELGNKESGWIRRVYNSFDRYFDIPEVQAVTETSAGRVDVFAIDQKIDGHTVDLILGRCDYVVDFTVLLDETKEKDSGQRLIRLRPIVVEIGVEDNNPFPTSNRRVIVPKVVKAKFKKLEAAGYTCYYLPAWKAYAMPEETCEEVDAIFLNASRRRTSK